MAYTVIVVLFAVIEFIVFGAQVGNARGKYNVVAPATSGHEQFERLHRIHQNTLEQLLAFIPSILAFGYFVDPNWGAAIGCFFLVGRVLYARAYALKPETRITGILVTVIPTYILLAGGLGGAIWSLF